MEHRHNERLATKLPAIVYTGNGQRISVTITNLSCGGAFLVLPADRAIVRGLVDVEFSLPFSELRRYRWRAFVVQQHADGIGVMFDDVKLGELLPYLASAKAMQRGRATARVAA